ncbi:MAG: DNA internalization-related competence protein ComEC/Rec2 [Muribaculum sp.]|nr:DNA internalization-related competence protein ComEC/Rec2 [Muribaculum sp.]
MRRPLFLCSFCLIMLIALWHYGSAATGAAGTAGIMESGPPDGTCITLAGRVCQKDETSFVIQTNLTNLIAADHTALIPNTSNIPNAAAVHAAEIPNTSNIPNAATVLWQSDSTDRITFDRVGGRTVKLRCLYDAAEELILDSAVVVEGVFYAFSPATNPGEFDYARYYASMGYGGRLKEVKVLAADGRAPGIREGLYRLRRFWEKRLYRIFPEKEASVMAAVLLGNKSDVDADVKALYQKNGIVHILSISGLHITLLGMGLYKLLRKIGAPVWCAALGGGVMLLLYGLMTGMSVSVCRALGMYLLRMLAQLVGRTYDMRTALGVTAAVMVCVRPAWLEHMGFLLSFGSVLGVGVLLPALSDTGDAPPAPKRYREGNGGRLARRMDKLQKGLVQSLLAGLSVTLTTLPIQLWFTYEVPVYSVLLNLLVLPFMGILTVTGLAAMLIPGLGIVGTADVAILAGYETLCGWFGQLPDPMWNPGRPALWQMAVYYMLWAAAVWGAGVIRYLGRHFKMRVKKRMPQSRTAVPDKRASRSRKTVGKCAQAALLGAAVLVMGCGRFHGDRVTFLDVGQGDCICVQLATGEVYLFDCGSSSRSRIGEQVLIPFLKYYGIGRIDAVLVSHADQDHMNGVAELLAKSGEEGIDVGCLVLPGIDRDLWQDEFAELLAAAADGGQGGSVPVSVIRAGESWSGGTDGEDRFWCLHPQADGTSKGGNEGSECFYIELREGDNQISLLLAGDVEGAGERALLEELRAREIQSVGVYKVAHHGSRNSSPQELLNQIQPQISLISCGRNNRYGHPHAELLERIGQTGSRILDTPHCGAVTLELRGNGIRLDTVLGE